jgi:hypothetical protein
MMALSPYLGGGDSGNYGLAFHRSDTHLRFNLDAASLLDEIIPMKNIG